MPVKITDIPKEEFIYEGSAACPGCPATSALRMVLKALGKDTIMVVPACCTAVIEALQPKTSFKVPLMNVAFETAAVSASGIEAGLRSQGKENITVLAWAGDGGTYDIGLQSLSGAFERRANILYICYNNEMYSNTGIQRSGATPKYAWTTTTWSGKGETKKDLVEIIKAHDPAYLATASVGYPEDIYEKTLKAKGIKGPKYIEILAPCPPGWKFPMNKTLELGRLAVETGLWPLYEYQNGRHYFTGVSRQLLTGAREFKPVEEYIKLQGRFSHITSPQINQEALQDITKRRDEYWKRMRLRIKMEEEIDREG